MSNALNAGLTDVYRIMQQIEVVKSQSPSTEAAAGSNTIDPGTALISFQENLNTMMNDLTSSSDDNNNESHSDPFAFINSSNNASFKMLTNRVTQSSSTEATNLDVNSYTGSLNTNLNLNNLF